MDWAGLLEQVDKYFDLEDLRTLCFILGEDYDNLRGEGKKAKARELILQQYRKGQMSHLVAELTRQRPHISWKEPTATHHPTGTIATSTPTQQPHFAHRTRPASGGASIGHYRTGAATLGCLVVDREPMRHIYILGDLSGLCPAGITPRLGDPIIQPGRADGGNLSRDQIATMSRWGILQDDPLAAADNVAAAIAQVRNLADASPEIHGRGFLKGIGTAIPGMKVFGVGRTSGLVSGRLVQTDVTIDLPWPINQITDPSHSGDNAGHISILFGGLIACDLKMVPGDSGLILLDGGNYALGLGFAAGEGLAFFIPIQKVLDTLNVDLVTEEIWQGLNRPVTGQRGETFPTSLGNGPDETATTITVTSPDDRRLDPTIQVPSPKIIEEISRQLKRRRLALFIGADFAETLTGIPDRRKLADLLARQEGLEPGRSLALIAQTVMGPGNRWHFTNFLREATDTTGKAPQPIHQAVVDLVQTYQIDTLITTAYDDLLDFTFRQAGSGLNVVVSAADIKFINREHPTLIRLYGHYRQPDSLVVTEQDQNALLRGRSKRELIDEIQHTFRRHTILYLGHDLSDPTVAALIDELIDEQSPRSYAVWNGLSTRETEFFVSKRNVELLPVDPLQLLQALVHEPLDV